MSNPYDGWSSAQLDAEQKRIDREFESLAVSQGLCKAFGCTYVVLVVLTVALLLFAALA